MCLRAAPVASTGLDPPRAIGRRKCCRCSRDRCPPFPACADAGGGRAQEVGASQGKDMLVGLGQVLGSGSEC